MPKLIMMRGLPASGKSTKAKEIMDKFGGYVRLNRDLMRTMLHFDRFTGRNEGITIDLQVAMAENLLAKGIGVIIDDTNLGDRHLDRWKNIAKKTDSKFEVMEMKTTMHECVERDYSRKDSVGKHVITNMALQYGLWHPEYPIILCDLDGTLCDISHRLHHVKKTPKDWKGFFADIPNDLVRENVFNMLSEHASQGCFIALVSARPETYRKETVEWLEMHEIKYDTLIMRRGHDKRPDTEVKQDILNTYFHDKSKIILVIDDRPSVIRMWKENGLNVIDVGDGVEF